MPVFAEEELFYPSRGIPAMKIVSAHKLSDNIEQYNRLLKGCSRLHKKMLAYNKGWRSLFSLLMWLRKALADWGDWERISRCAYI